MPYTRHKLPNFGIQNCDTPTRAWNQQAWFWYEANISDTSVNILRILEPLSAYQEPIFGT